ncbi:hypothetical protein D5876_02070 [Salmonella enterica subsp. enterica serovar Carno]|nr:hypothetical protein [Salmonella enterica subsp. enterica serovar Carno]EBV8479949.1 hypothetical protein [Salmonella enterica subsp. enterica serovar Ago]EBW2075840.1 hypothetical protein [Salmonella enterica subsp. enterica serovar Krefeld]ECF6645586.1 hypothetical protein [Salmonella enterica subsp. enterica]HAV6648113.1 hypothetical protein [Salmonella enterica]
MCQNVVSHDVAQAAIRSLRAKSKEPCLTSRVFYFLRPAFRIKITRFIFLLISEKSDLCT